MEVLRLPHLVLTYVGSDDGIAAGNAPPRATVEARLAKPECLVEMVVTAAVK